MKVYSTYLKSYCNNAFKYFLIHEKVKIWEESSQAFLQRWNGDMLVEYILVPIRPKWNKNISISNYWKS